MKKIYIAGCGGMLGEAMYVQLVSEYQLKCTDMDVNEKWLEFCDFRDFNRYQKDVLDFKPDFLFHIGALTDLEYCETHPNETYLTNTISVENAAHIAGKLGIAMVYISTAGIFDGKKEFYEDEDIPKPICHYARSKYLGEITVQQNLKKYFICRPGWMMGGGANKDKKFVNKIIKQIKEGRKMLYIVNDKLGTPTYTHDFVNNVKALIQTEYWGVYNMCCQGLTSRLEITQEIIRFFNLEKEVKIQEVSSEYFKKEYFVVRPNSERLINKKLELLGLNKMRNWKVALNEYLARYYANNTQADVKSR